MDFVDGPCDCVTSKLFNHRKSMCSITKSSTFFKPSVISASDSTRNNSKHADAEKSNYEDTSVGSSPCDCPTSALFPHRKYKCATVNAITALGDATAPMISAINDSIDIGSSENVGKTPSESKSESKGGILQTQAALDETRTALIERGEKLTQLSDKSAELSNSANDFAVVSKQLREQQERSWW